MSSSSTAEARRSGRRLPWAEPILAELR
jgi:hypothetical protein